MRYEDEVEYNSRGCGCGWLILGTALIDFLIIWGLLELGAWLYHAL